MLHHPRLKILDIRALLIALQLPTLLMALRLPTRNRADNRAGHPGRSAPRGFRETEA
jgi:hypothetical protein